MAGCAVSVDSHLPTCDESLKYIPIFGPVVLFLEMDPEEIAMCIWAKV